MLDIVLIRPETGGNIGSIARVMANFNCKNLILINPRCKKDSIEARKRAKHALPILEKAKVKTETYLKRYDYLIATTAIIGSDYNIPRSPIPPEKILLNPKVKTALIIGPESSGLSNEEIKKADYVVTIPTSPKYPTLNISHAVAIILYELFKKTKDQKVGDQINPATKVEKDALLKIINLKLKNMKFNTKEKRATQKVIWKRLIGKGTLTKREAFALFGFFRKIK